MRTALVACVLLLASTSLAADSKPAKKLIEFGWDQPDAAFMRAHIQEMENTPFDGTVFCLTGPLLWEGWGTRRFTDEDVSAALRDLKATPFKRFTENFLRFDVTPGNVDWFDDFTAITGNAELMARVAREGKARGILFDIEQYESHLFQYAEQRDAATKSWEQYSAQAHKRGAEVMRAFQTGYPGLTVLMTFGMTLPHQRTHGKLSRLSEGKYGLLVGFLNGMIEAAADDVRIVDGYEFAYPFKTEEEFHSGYEHIREGVLPLVADHEKYARLVTCGFGVWMDYKWKDHGWNEDDFSKNFFTPEAFEHSVRVALKQSDEYVWIYTETPRWWSAKGPEKLPKEYDEALRRASDRK